VEVVAEEVVEEVEEVEEVEVEEVAEVAEVEEVVGDSDCREASLVVASV
jgi:hypothetical protein